MLFLIDGTTDMGTKDRAYSRDVNDFSKRFKRPFRIIAELMPVGFTDEFFLATFKECYPGLWESVIEFKKQYDMMDIQLRKKKLQPIYHFPSPENFILWKSKRVIANTRNEHVKGIVKSAEEQSYIRQHLISKSENRESEKAEQKAEAEHYLQHVEPINSNYFIQLYFSNRGEKQELVNTRYQILQEASKFKCKATIEFMLKVNAIEPNLHLRNYAFQTLQKKFGFPQIKLKRNHPNAGKDLHIEPYKIDTPEKLMNEIVQAQFKTEANKLFDVFLSHSSLDKEKVFEVKTLLNAKGLTVYVDWIEDRESLKRELTCAETAKVIIERIKKSKAIVYIKTENSALSLWTPWELGYAQAIGKKITVLEIEYIAGTPQYLDIYDKSKLMEDGSIMVDDEDEILPIELWINK